MPFSSLAAGASVVRASSNTGGLGGVILHRHVEKQAGQHIRIASVKAALSTTKCDGRKTPYIQITDETHLWRLRASLMEFFTTRQLLLAGRGEEASGSSMLGSL